MKTAVVIGSGFGGSVMSCRLRQRGYDVHILERGRRYGRNQFPRRTDQLHEAFWDPEDGMYGMFEYRSFAKTDIDVLTSSGWGGGSLIYANVLYRMPPEFFEDWPGGINRAFLDPYYDTVLRMMEASPYPHDKPDWPYAQTPKTIELRRAAQKLAADPIGYPASQLEYPHLAVRFGKEPGKEELNSHGVPQTNCIMCGECDVGCNYHAKNTLDLNYLAVAEQLGASVHLNSEAIAILPDHNGRPYTVVYADPRNRAATQSLDADVVVVSAGSLGSTRLLLRMKQSGVMPNLSPTLGTKWCGNGDFLAFALGCDNPIYPTTGPVITSAVRFFHGSYPDGFPHGLWVEDAGYPNFAAWYLTALTSTADSMFNAMRGAVRYAEGFLGQREVNVGDDLSALLFHESRVVSKTMIFLCMGRDRSTGVMTLRPRGDRPLTWKDDCQVHLDWEYPPSALHFERAREDMQRLAQALGGDFQENPLSFLTRYISVHPLGGCPLGDTIQEGVANARTGEVFGYPGLYVSDSSMIPTSAGPN
ncbi:MAG: GMC family oxidoreductase N-terminal domain-containing protein, partial [Bryobacteraceae bacterium]